MSKDVKLKKKHRFLATKIVVIFSTVFVVAPVATFMGLFYVADTKDVSAVTPENISTTLTNRLFRSIGELSEQNSTLKLTFDDQTLDGLLMYVNQDVVGKTEASNYLPKFYCTINDNKYNFYADVRTNALKTRVELDTTLEGNDEDLLKFTIDNIKLGRLSISKNILSNITSKFINSASINKALEDVGFRANIDFENMQLTYKKETFKDDLGTFLTKATESNKELAPMNAVFNMIGFDADCIKPTYKNGLSIALNLSNFASKEEIKIPGDLELNLKLRNTQALSIVNDKDFVKTQYYIDKNKTTDDITSDLITFYNYGLEKADNAETPIKELVEKNKELVEEKFEIDDISTHDPKIEIGTGKIFDLDTEIKPFLATSGSTLNLTSDKINQYLNSLKIIGKPFSLSLKTDSGYQNAYLALNNFCFEIIKGNEESDDYLNVYFGVDFNGLTMNSCIQLNPAKIKLENGNLTFTINGKEGTAEEGYIQIGSIKVDKKTITQIVSSFNSVGSFSFNDGTFTINFSGMEKYKIGCEITKDDTITLTNNGTIQ